MSGRVFVTGGAGFIGREMVRQLRQRGDAVTAIIRNPDQIAGIRALGAQPVAGDLASTDAIQVAMTGCDAVIHAAGSYRVGILPRERPQMYEANVAATRRVLDAAIGLGIPRIVHVSTINAFGNTGGRIVDETYRRDPADGFNSYYDETKYLSQVAAETRMAAGAPGGLAVRVGTLRLNVAEIVRAADGVTFWASSAKALAELGYAPRAFRQGVVDAFGTTLR